MTSDPKIVTNDTKVILLSSIEQLILRLQAQRASFGKPDAKNSVNRVHKFAHFSINEQ